MCENTFSHMSSRHLNLRSSYISLPIGNDSRDNLARNKNKNNSTITKIRKTVVIVISFSVDLKSTIIILN